MAVFPAAARQPVGQHGGNTRGNDRATPMSSSQTWPVLSYPLRSSRWWIWAASSRSWRNWSRVARLYMPLISWLSHSR